MATFCRSSGRFCAVMTISANSSDAALAFDAGAPCAEATLGSRAPAATASASANDTQCTQGVCGGLPRLLHVTDCFMERPFMACCRSMSATLGGQLGRQEM